MNPTAHPASRLPQTVTTLGLAALLLVLLLADVPVAVAAAGVANLGWLLTLGVGLVVGAVALLRRPGPVRRVTWCLTIAGAATVAADVWRLPTQPGLAATAALLVLGAAAVRVASTRQATVVAVAGGVVMTVGRLTVHAQYVLPLVLLGLIAWGLALSCGMWLRLSDARRRRELDEVRRDERLELARELHDVVAHHVAGIVVQAQAARIAASKHPELLKSSLDDIEKAGADALTAMRRVVGILRTPEEAAPMTGGLESIADLLARFAARGPEVVATLPEDGTAKWSPEIAATVHRVVQEALTNVTLHAPDATTVTVTIEDAGTSVVAIVANDGVVDPAAPGRSSHSGGHGLVGMRERVEALGGHLEAGYDEDGRWTVQANLPQERTE